jgi:hypothetical protein
MVFFFKMDVNPMLNLLKRTMTYPGFEPGTFGLAVSIANHYTISVVLGEIKCRVSPVKIFDYPETLVLDDLKLYFVRSGAIKPCFDTLSQNGSNAGFVK